MTYSYSIRKHHTILVKLLTFVDFCVFLDVLAFG